MSESVRDFVRDGYGATADAAGSLDAAGAARVAAAFGYGADELAALPDGANLGLSCGNPTATASLKPGETVVDFGSGGGLDVFLASKKVGPTGRAIGIDMTPSMIDLARRNAATGGYTNVAFHLAEIEETPLDDASVDCVISNCVINLSPEKPRVFAELFRILKPGGRVAISDIALKKALPADLAESLDAYVGCFAGAISVEAYKDGLTAAGFSDIAVIDDGSDLNAYGEIDGQAGCCAPVAQTEEPTASSCCGPAPVAPKKDVHGSLRETLKAYDVNEYAASVKIYAIKPAS